MSNESCENQIRCSVCSLGKLCYPDGLSLDELRHLDDLKIRHIEIDKGEFLFRQHEPFKQLFTVKVGSFKSFTSSYYGHEQITGFCLPGELIGLDSISASEYVSSVVALEKSYVCEVSFTQLFELSSKVPSLQRRILNLVSKSLSPELSIGVNSSAKARVSHFLLNLAARFKQRGLSAVNITLSMSREDMGNYLGLATETVSRTLHLLQEEKLIELNRRQIKLLNSRQLQVYSCEKTSTN